jgi:hypothetical protein
MRLVIGIIASILVAGLAACAHIGARVSGPAFSGATLAAPAVNSNGFPAVAARVDFTTQIRPMLEKCQPCHFAGGKVYQRLPFDRPETVKTLGTKLFTRIKDENERRLIRDFLAQE